MKQNVRAAVAAMALGHAGDRNISSVYDYKSGRHVNVSVTVHGDRLDGYDYEKSCHFGGTLPSAYHYGEKAHIELKSKGGGKYSGYDYGERCHFDVTVNGKNAEIYDYGDRGFFSYSS